MQQQNDGTYERTIRAVMDVENVERIGKKDSWKVESSSSNEYVVDRFSTGWECGCPDYDFRDPEGGCKHIRRVQIKIGERDEPLVDIRHTTGGSR